MSLACWLALSLFLIPCLAEPSRAADDPAPGERVIQTDDAVAAGLQWLARRQGRAGNWSMDGSYRSDVAATAFGLLPLLEAGETHKTGGALHPYARHVERGLRYLL